MILEKIEKIEKIEQEFNTCIDFKELKAKSTFPDKKALEKEFQDITKYSDILKIGIIGRVKAGKSSLLNALIFNADDVLPQAATPMTAALTVITYDEKLSASVEIYGEEDLKRFTTDAKSYEKELANFQEEIFKENCEEKLERTGSESLSESEKEQIRIFSYEQAKMQFDAQKPMLKASFEQDNALKTAKKPDELFLEANNLEELKTKLGNYVGASGIYTPYTKSITLRLNLEQLKGIEIVDTPGVCDPIRSRGARTQEFISKCHMAFVVSPSGQFLSNDDAELINQNCGINDVNLFVVASKADTQIHGSERKNANGNLAKALESIRTKLGNSLKEFCKGLDEKNSKRIDKNVILNSGMSYNALEHLDNLNDAESEFLKRLEKSYPVDFDEKNRKNNLQILANIEQVRQALEYSKSKKDAIISERIENFNQIQNKKIDEFCNLCIKFYEEKIQNLQNLNISKNTAKRKGLEERSQQLREIIDEIYQNKLQFFKSSSAKAIENALDSAIFAIKNKAKYAQQSETRNETYQDSKTITEGSLLRTVAHYATLGIVDKTVSSEINYTRTRFIKTDYVETNEIAAFLQDGCKKIEEVCNKDLQELVNGFKCDVELAIKRAMSENDFIDENEISLPSEIFEICAKEMHFNLPDCLKPSGKILDNAARTYVKNLKEFGENLEQNAKNELNNLINSMIVELSNLDFSKKILQKIERKLTELEIEGQNKMQSIEKYQKIISQIKGVME